MKFILASKNRRKLEELNRILLPLGIGVVNEQDIGIELPDVDETGDTFEENARLKAESACKIANLPAIADDSGLCVDGLDGRPGVYSARFAGPEQNDDANIDKLLDLLKDIPLADPRRNARFVSAICCCFPDGRSFTVRGESHGYIDVCRRGENGFGYDPVFICNGVSFANMTDEEKDKVSHRGIALNKLAEKLKEYMEF